WCARCGRACCGVRGAACCSWWSSWPSSPACCWSTGPPNGADRAGGRSGRGGTGRGDRAGACGCLPVLPRPVLGPWLDGWGGAELGKVVLGDPAAVAGVDQAGDAVEQAGPGLGGQVAVAGVGVHHLQVAGGGVRLVPLVAAELGGPEPAGPVELLTAGGDA